MKHPIKSALWATVVLLFAITAFTFFRDRFQPADHPYDLLQQNISLTASDGKILDAVISIPVPTDSTVEKSLSPGVILLSPYLESGQIYGQLPLLLGRNGFAVLTVNARYSFGADSMAVLNPADIAALPLDAQAAIQYLENSPHVDAKRIGILGTGLTARAALLGSQGRSNIKAAVLVSAALDEQAMEVIRDTAFRPVLILVSISDGPAGTQAKEILAASAHPDSKIESYFGAGEDSEIWRAATSTEMMLLIVDWLKARLSQKE